MNKLLSVIVAAMFAVGSTAFVASPVGAQPKDEKKEKAEKKKAPEKKPAGEKKPAAEKKPKAEKKDK